MPNSHLLNVSKVPNTNRISFFYPQPSWEIFHPFTGGGPEVHTENLLEPEFQTLHAESKISASSIVLRGGHL